MRHFLPSVLLTMLALPCQTITFAEGTPTSLTIATVAESDPTAADTVILQDVEFVPIEMTGRTLAHELDATRSRRIERNGIVRLELPGGARLLRYRRAAGAFWGFLHIGVDGAPRVVLERPGVGATALGDPFLDRIAIADDGRHAAIARTSGALHVVRLDGALYPGTGRTDWIVGNGIDPVPISVMVGPTFLWFQADGGLGNQLRVWRCDLAEGSVPVDVSPPFVPNGDFKDQMVMSRDGAHVVFLYGPQQQQRLYHAGPTGGSNVLPPLADKYEEPGYLPEEPGEPAMLLNDDGSQLFYVVADVRDELFLLDMNGQMPSLSMTEDAVFQPYIGMHILPKFAGGSLLIAIGDPAQMDWYRATLAAGTVTNVSGTGSLVPPFNGGVLDPLQAAEVGGRLLVVENQAGTMTLRRVDPLAGTSVALEQDLLLPPTTGGSIGAPADVHVRSAAGDSLYGGLGGDHLFTLPQGIQLTPPVQGPLFAGTWMHLPIQWGVPVFYLPGGIVTLPLEFGLEQIVMTATGGVVLVGNPVRYLSLGTYAVLPRPAAPFRTCLSGAGG